MSEEAKASSGVGGYPARGTVRPGVPIQAQSVSSQAIFDGESPSGWKGSDAVFRAAGNYCCPRGLRGQLASLAGGRDAATAEFHTVEMTQQGDGGRPWHGMLEFFSRSCS